MSIRSNAFSTIDTAHGDIRRRERACETLLIFATQPGIGELASQRRVIAGAIRRRPSHRGSIFGARLTDGGAAKQMQQGTGGVPGGRSPPVVVVDLIRRNVRELGQHAARLLEHLSAYGILGRFAVLDATAGQEPRTGEWTAALTDEQHPSARVDARDDRADAPYHGGRVGLGGTVRPEGNGGSVSDGTTKGVPLGRTVGPGVNPVVGEGDDDGEGEGDGDGEKVGHGSVLTTFQL